MAVFAQYAVLAQYTDRDEETPRRALPSPETPDGPVGS